MPALEVPRLPGVDRTEAAERLGIGDDSSWTHDHAARVGELHAESMEAHRAPPNATS
jgi:hypothetical protein